MSAFQNDAAGDSAMIVEFEDRIDAAINAQALAVARRLQAQPVAGVRDVVPSYRSVTVYFDPLQTSHDALTARLEREAVHAVPEAAPARDEIRIPVCYGGDLGPDLADVAAFGGISESAAVDLHLGMAYRVYMLGFMLKIAALTLSAPKGWVKVKMLFSPRKATSPR
jgi:inhibitor of KinA